MRRFPFPEAPEFVVFKKLHTPAKVQDFLNSIPVDFGRDGDTCRSPRATLGAGIAHCVEGALLAAAIFWYHGRRPLLFDLETTKKDDSHVLALFREPSGWGAVSKTNHGVLRFRDPIYKTLRELALSYFHEYFLDTGEKTLRRHSKKPLDLLAFEDDWLIAEHPVWGIYEDLADAPHEQIADARAVRRLRRADAIEIEAGKLVEWKKRKQPE
jgi:hypothetical protein